MKTSFLAALLLLLLTPSFTQAQTAAKPKPKAPATAAAKPKAVASPATPAPALDDAKVAARAKALTDNMKQALALNPAQTEKVSKINLTSVRNVETARIQHRTDLRKLNSIVEDIGSSRLAALKDVLSADQFARYQRKREEKMGIPDVRAAQGNAAPGLSGSQE